MPLELSIANDGANVTVTQKKRLRVSDVHVTRGAAITFSTQRVLLDNSTDADLVVNSGPQVTRQVETTLAETVTIAGQPVTLQTLLNGLGKFYDKWRAEDVATNP